jgi:hypothetical protein
LKGGNGESVDAYGLVTADTLSRYIDHKLQPTSSRPRIMIKGEGAQIVLGNYPQLMAKPKVRQKRKALEFTIEKGDIMSFDADILVLKYAEGLHGITRKVAMALEEVGIAKESLTGNVGE